MTKEKISYHHENLKNDLIEQGIAFVNKYGVQNLSLRKVAASCKVSHAAPYAHFKNKDEFVLAMQQYISNRFAQVLLDAAKDSIDEIEALEKMGIAYVKFFIENPQYFSFMYSHNNLKIDLTATVPREENNYPFLIYRDIVVSLLKKQGLPKEKWNDVIISLWAFIHGIASLTTMESVYFDHKWEEKVRDFMQVLSVGILERE